MAAAVWHRSDQDLILAALTLGYLLAVLGIGWGLAHRLRTWRPWAETRAQIHEDEACLAKLLPDDDSSALLPALVASGPRVELPAKDCMAQ